MHTCYDFCAIWTAGSNRCPAEIIFLQKTGTSIYYLHGPNLDLVLTANGRPDQNVFVVNIVFGRTRLVISNSTWDVPKYVNHLILLNEV